MAIESMTGFARHETACADGTRIVCEVRSVNGKSLDIRVRLPQGLDRLEPQIRHIVQAAIARGNLQITVSLEDTGQRQDLRLNQTLLDEIVKLAASLHARHGLALPTIGELLSMRGVMETEATLADHDVDKAVLKAVQGAATALKAFRAREGEALKALLHGQLLEIEKLTVKAAADVSRSPERIRERLAAQVQLLMDSAQGFDAQRLAAEAAILATKADIREELDRLDSHVATAKELMSGVGPVGRKLDFLSQEFNREANTLCSKSNASSMTTIGLELKAVVDQFREQVQNLE
jgi:uncharacterized protein (TIGR00255 family)